MKLKEGERRIMYKLTTIMELLKRMRRKHELAAVAMAALLFLSALPATATAQDTSASTYTGLTVVHAGTIGLAPGQTLIVSVPNSYFEDGSVRFVKHSIKVYDRESKLVYSGESGSMSGHEFGHILTLGYGDIPVPGEPRTSRKQLWIEVESFSLSPTQAQAEDPAAGVPAPVFEIVDDGNGKTTVYGSFGQGSWGLDRIDQRSMP
jgi:hypothetical protein